MLSFEKSRVFVMNVGLERECIGATAGITQEKLLSIKHYVFIGPEKTRPHFIEHVVTRDLA